MSTSQSRSNGQSRLGRCRYPNKQRRASDGARLLLRNSSTSAEVGQRDTCFERRRPSRRLQRVNLLCRRSRGRCFARSRLTPTAGLGEKEQRCGRACLRREATSDPTKRSGSAAAPRLTGDPPPHGFRRSTVGPRRFLSPSQSSNPLRTTCPASLALVMASCRARPRRRSRHCLPIARAQHNYIVKFQAPNGDTTKLEIEQHIDTVAVGSAAARQPRRKEGDLRQPGFEDQREWRRRSRQDG
jgi:hypothetical protein